jgi:hypothetical protein
MTREEDFFETYFDDLLNLIDARKALLSHPLRASYPPIVDASFCRMLAIVAIWHVEGNDETLPESALVRLSDGVSQVEPRGVEPLTSTMPLGSPTVVDSCGAEC